MMGEGRLYAYSRPGGIAIGSLEIIFGTAAIIFHIAQYVMDVSTAVHSTGIWAGLFYILLGIVTLFAGVQQKSSLVKASLGLSILGFFVVVGAITTAAILWLLTGFNTVSGYGESYRRSNEVAAISNGAVILLSLLTFFLMIASVVLSCIGLSCCPCCVCCEPEPVQPTTYQEEKFRVA